MKVREASEDGSGRTREREGEQRRGEEKKKKYIYKSRNCPPDIDGRMEKNMKRGKKEENKY